jgi:hypothetical protein
MVEAGHFKRAVFLPRVAHATLLRLDELPTSQIEARHCDAVRD